MKKWLKRILIVITLVVIAYLTWFSWRYYTAWATIVFLVQVSASWWTFRTITRLGARVRASRKSSPFSG